MKRRDLLKASFLSGGAVLGSSLLGPSAAEAAAFSIVKQLIKNAQQEALGASGLARNYVAIELFGAPNRFAFDQWIRSNPDDVALVLPSAMTHTKLNFSNGGSGNVAATELGYFAYRNKLVPHLFSTAVQISNGSHPLTELLDNMAVIRGYGTGVDGHPTNATRQMAPVGGLPSISGTLADQSDKLFSAVGWPSRSTVGVFISKKQKSLNALTSPSTPLHQLLEGFGLPPADRVESRNLKNKYRNIYERAMDTLKLYANSEALGHEIVRGNMDKAQILIKRGISDLDGYWTPAVDKYTSAFNINCRAMNIPGFSTGSILDLGQLPAGHMSVDFEQEGASRLDPSFDLRTALSTMFSPTLPGGFALTEYLLQQDLSSCVELLDVVCAGTTVKRTTDTAVVSKSIHYDMHFWGAATGIVVSAALFRGISALILELKLNLSAKKISGGNSLWDNTAVHILSEFGRSPRATGAGSDHGFNAMISSVFSGSISEPLVVGNVLSGGLNADYPGGQGLAAPIEGYNQAGSPNPAMLASTMTQVLQLADNPWKNLAEPLLVNSNGKLIYNPTYGKGKVVPGGFGAT